MITSQQMSCLDPVEVLDLLNGRLLPPERSRTEEHLEGCTRCRRLQASLSGTLSTDPLPVELITDQLAATTDPALDLPAERRLDEILGRRYRLLDRLGQGGMGLVVRALDRLTGQHVALKLVSLRPQSPANPRFVSDSSDGGLRHHTGTGRSDVSATTAAEPPGSRLTALAQEFRTLVTLRHPNVISVLDYGFDAGRPYFTMELLSDARPLLPLAATVPLTTQLELLVQLLRALAYLHRRGIVHRDLKPSNILVLSRPAGLSLKVLDFGLAIQSTDRPRGKQAGTLLYMAPEVLRGAAASAASDLYAVGVMAYQMLTGHHPFAAASTEGVPGLLRTSRLDLAPIPPPLRELIGRALSQSATERPADATAFLQELASAAGVRLTAESPAARDSYLVAARFVGRKAELGVLKTALAEARAGRGAAFLLGGESGVGKSRLLDELRSQALLDGVLVVRGQAIASGGTSYQLWQGALPALALHGKLDELAASVLRTVLPDVAAILARPVAAPPELDAQSAWLRLLHVLRELVLRPSQPVVILLEDLQWADAESLALLTQVSGSLATRSLLIVASYRDDEAPRLPGALPAMQTMKLGRLRHPDMAQLCESILGPSGRDAALLDLIGRETEGNTYFIVEVLRALAADAGSLDAIGHRRLPERVFAGGIESMLARRLQHVSASAQELLQVAAVMGRQLHPQVLAALYPEFDALIEQCVEAGVLELDEQRWRFSHDKLRERVLAALSPEEQQPLHRRIAETLQTRSDPGGVPAAQVAYHYHRAQLLDKAARYYALAGAAALQRGAPAEANAALEQALALHRQLQVPLLEQVQVWRRLTQARYGLGHLSSTDAALRQVCARLGRALPSDSLQLAWALARQLSELLVRRTPVGRALRVVTKSEPERALDHELLQALTTDEMYVWLSKPGVTLLCILWGLNLADALEAQTQQTHFRAGIAFLLSFTRLGSVGLRFLDKGPTSQQTVGEIDALRIKAMVALHQGRFPAAAEHAVHAVAQARAQKDDFALMYSLLQQQFALVELDDFTQVIEVSREMERLATMAQNPRYVVLALIGQIGAFLRFGELYRTEPLLTRARNAGELGPALEAALNGLGAMCALHQDRLPCARQLADEAMAAVRRVRWPLLQLRYALIGILDVYLDEGLAVVPAQAKQALTMLRWIAREFAVVKSTDALYRGRHQLRYRRWASARTWLQESLNAAQKYGVRYDQAQAHYWLGRVTLREFDGNPRRKDAAENLRASLALFDRLGAVWEADRTRRALHSLDGA